MQQYNFFQAFAMSFYSQNLYRDVAKNWGLNVLGYLLLLLSILWIVTLGYGEYRNYPGLKSWTNNIVAQLPSSILINKSTVTTPQNKPYLIVDPDTKENILVIDTSGKYKSLKDVATRVLVTRNNIFYWDEHDNVATRTISSHIAITVGSHDINKFFGFLLHWLWVIVLPFCVLIAFVYRVAETVLYALIGKLIAAVSRVQLAYVQSIRIAVVALTPVIVIGTVFNWANIRFTHELGVLFLVAMAYLIFAVRANATQG